MYFEEAGIKPMILNVARSKAIEKVAGSPELEDWPGVKIQLYIEHGIKAFGDIVNAVRVRPFKPRAQAGGNPSLRGLWEGDHVRLGNKPGPGISRPIPKRSTTPICAPIVRRSAKLRR